MTLGPKISIVILNWNGSGFLKRFLPSVVAHSALIADIIVADNGSSDDSRIIVETLFPSVTYLQFDRNFGFAAGYNKAFQLIQNEFFVLLNSDVEVTEGWLDPMLKLMETDLSIGAIQPKILSLDRPTEFEYAGAAGGFIDMFGYPYCRGRILQEVEKDLGQYDDYLNVSWASGACMMVRSSVWQECGGFDIDFWAHMEEIDLCWRMHHLGYSVTFCPESVVYHLGGGTLNYNDPKKIFLNFRNNLYLLFKNLPLGQLLIILPSRMILDGLAAFTFFLKGDFGAFRKVFLAHFKFYGQLPWLMKKRKIIFGTAKKELRNLMVSKSILWNYFVLKRRRFSELKLPKQ